MVTLGVEYMNLCIVKCHDDVLVCEMEARHYALIRGDLLLEDFASRSPRSLHHVSLFEVTAIRHCFRSLSFELTWFHRSIQALSPQIRRAGASAVHADLGR